METRLLDVVVVGAGFAGLTAADRLVSAGKRVAVVEARGRVGGRIATVHLADGTPIDIGGQWLGPTQDRMYALAKRYGAPVYPMYIEGKNLLELEGKTRGYRGHIPLRVPPFALMNLGWVLARLDRLARRVPLEAPWEARDASDWDQRTLGDFLRRNVRDSRAYAMTKIGIEAVFAADPDEISLLHALFYMRSGGSFDALTKSEGGAQQDRVTFGIQALAEGLARDVDKPGSTVALDTVVRAITQEDDGVTVTCDDREYRARNAIVAVPPPLALEIDFRPQLSSARCELLRRLTMGRVIKCVAAYDRPFWREAGLSGQAVSDQGPVHVTFDASPASGRPGLLMGFIEGPAAVAFGRESPEARRDAVLACFARHFGSEAARPREYVDRAWADEPFSRGCYAAVFPPGVWSTVGSTIRKPEGRVHWAGTETATIWNGYIEGAVRSGERVAEEVLRAHV